MTAITLEITPDLESRLHREAAREGLDTQGYILRSLLEHLGRVPRPTVPRLPADESALLQEINRGLPSETWQQYGELKTKRQEGTLTSDEQTDLINLSDRIEDMNVRRMESVIQLARLRQMSVDALMDDLGIKSPVHD